MKHSMHFSLSLPSIPRLAISALAISNFILLNSAFATPTPGGDPSSLKIKVYAVYASLSAQCTNPINVFSNDAGAYMDFLSNPTLGGGDLADGTYNCVIIKMSSIIKHTPKTTATTCVAGTEYTGGVCNASDSATDLNNATITCSGDGSNAGSVDSTVYMYMTTDAGASTGSHAFQHPMAANDGLGIKLGAPLVISSVTKAKFVVNANGGVVAGGGECGINPPVFSFLKL